MPTKTSKNTSTYRAASGSKAENLFINLFQEVFGIEQTGCLCSQYHFYDIYQQARYADFLLESGNKKIAIEIDDEASHNPSIISSSKFQDDLLKQNSMIYKGWDVYRWPVAQMQKQRETVKDELKVFLGKYPKFRAVQDYLPKQEGSTFNGDKLELRNYQQEALSSLEQMRAQHKTIALLYQATGTGKTVTAVLDAQKVGGRTLFLAHTLELVDQAHKTFAQLWPEASLGYFTADCKDTESQIICASIQSLALNIDLFNDRAFDYIIIDEAHHATGELYQKVISYFEPKFLLGMTATPERTDDVDILSIFQNTAHRLDIRTAVEIGALVPVRCIRIHTNIDMTKVRFNSFQYNIRELDDKICVTERNNLIVNIWQEYVKNKRTVIFCASVKHAQLIAQLFMDAGIAAAAVSGNMKLSERNEKLDNFASGKLKVLCACDLLNEGWDCPQTEVLFMARPTMSKVLYIQQLGRGMRKAPNKEFLMVFDFVDNASQYNMPLSMHRIFKLKDYHPGGLVLETQAKYNVDSELYAKGEKPDAIIDFPVNVTDYEYVDVFNWQEKVADMLSKQDLVRSLTVQEETIDRYLREGLLVPDFIVPVSESRSFPFFNKENLEAYSKLFKCEIINDKNSKRVFMDMVAKMDMSYSYKPVFLQAFMASTDKKGQAKIDDIVQKVLDYYADRRNQGLIVEKGNSIYAKESVDRKAAERNILSNPFARFEAMNTMHHTKTLGIIELDRKIWGRLTPVDLEEIKKTCSQKLEEYYSRLESKSK